MNTRGFVFRNVGSKCIDSISLYKEPYSIVDTFVEKSAHSIDEKNYHYRFYCSCNLRTDTYSRSICFGSIRVFFCDILESQIPKLSKNTVECHSKKRERERDKTYVTVLYFLLHSLFPLFLWQGKVDIFQNLSHLTHLLLLDSTKGTKWPLMTC